MPSQSELLVMLTCPTDCLLQIFGFQGGKGRLSGTQLNARLSPAVFHMDMQGFVLIAVKEKAETLVKKQGGHCKFSVIYYRLSKPGWVFSDSTSARLNQILDSEKNTFLAAVPKPHVTKKMGFIEELNSFEIYAELGSMISQYKIFL